MFSVFTVTIIFLILMIIVAVFVAQQLSTMEKTQAFQRPKTLSERMRSGMGAIDRDKFNKYVMGAEGEKEQLVTPLVDSYETASSFDMAKQWPSDSSTGTDELTVNERMISQEAGIENKDLQTIYSEYLTAKSINPFDLDPEFRLGLAYLKFADYPKAQNQFRKVVETKEDFPKAYYYLGEAYRCNGQFFEAMTSYKKAWEIERPSLK